MAFGTLFRRIPTLALALRVDELGFQPEGEVYGSLRVKYTAWMPFR